MCDMKSNNRLIINFSSGDISDNVYHICYSEFFESDKLRFFSKIFSKNDNKIGFLNKNQLKKHWIYDIFFDE